MRLYRREKVAKLKERYHAFILMYEYRSCTMISNILKKSRLTIQAEVTASNKYGLEGINPKLPPR
ncbi:MAG: hypothetical protein ACTSRP_05310 [Candidatus Helarchaeota archaeon]